MAVEIDFVTIPTTHIRPGDHLCDSRLPMGNRVQAVGTLEDGRVIVIARGRDRGTQRTSVDYTGAGFALTFEPHKLTEVWYRA